MMGSKPPSSEGVAETITGIGEGSRLAGAAAPDAAGAAPLALYPRLLGAAWTDLDEAVRSMHLDGVIFNGQATFQVRHGRNPVARLLAWLARLPPPGAAVPTRLTVTRCGAGERWQRRFGTRTLDSTQLPGIGGCLNERFGALVFRFRLVASGGALEYRQVGAALRLGPLRVPLPAWLAPRASGREAPVPAGRTRVTAAVTLPLVGLLIAYDGEVGPAEEG
jgi:hypothetical protein